MKRQLNLDGYRFDLDRCYDLSIVLEFDGPQPRHFGATAATAEPMRAGEFVGDTRHGGSCNARVLKFNPHCNGTHTECVGHVTSDRATVPGLGPDRPCLAALVSVGAVPAGSTTEAGADNGRDDDLLITAVSIDKALQELHDMPLEGLIVRTLPNTPSKRTIDYGSQGLVTPYFSMDAVAYLVTRAITHLVCDLPSIDRHYDGGKLAGHRLFWGLPAASHALAAAARPRATITEMAYISDDVADGLYALDLQFPSLASDAVPSRPLLYAQAHDGATRT